MENLIAHALAEVAAGKDLHPNVLSALGSFSMMDIMKVMGTIASIHEIKDHKSGESGVIDIPDFIQRTSKDQRIIITSINYTVE